jgi:ketosteroid isomerase-like protein
MRRLISVLVLLLFTAACDQQAEEEVSAACTDPTGSADTEMQAIEATRDQEVAVFTSGDASLPHAADHVVIMPPGEPMVVGIEAARAWAADFMSRFTINTLDYTDSDIILTGDWAIERYAGSVTLTPADDDPVSETIKGIHIFQRQGDGSWKMVEDVWNFDPAPAGE